MAVGLKALFGPTHSPARRAGLAAVLVVVLAVHGWLAQEMADRINDMNKDTATVERIEVAYVRDMALSAPLAAAPAAPPPAAPAPRVARKPAPKPAKPASAPEALDEMPKPERAPEPVLAAVPVVPESLPEANAPEPPASTPEPLLAANTAASDAANTAASTAASAPAQAASAPAAFNWPLSTRVSYVLTGNYRGEVNGSAQVEWIRAGSRYQVHLDLVIGPSAAPLITRRMSSDGDITAEGLRPRRFEQDTKVVLRDRRHQVISFEDGSVVLANGERRNSVPGVQDTASQFVQLMYVFSTRPELLSIGNAVDIPLALAHKVDVWTYDVVGEEVLNAPFGPLPAIHLKPRRALAPKANELSAEIWFAPQLRYFPVRILIKQDGDNFVDLMISKRPEMAG